MLSTLTQVVYVALVPAGLVLGSATERVALVMVAAVLLLRLLVRHRTRAHRLRDSRVDAPRRGRVPSSTGRSGVIPLS